MKHVSRSLLPAYGVAGASTALATLAQFPLRPLVGSEHPYWFFYVAVLVTAWHGGLRRALLALALGALSANYFFLPPAHSLAITGTANQIGLALYLIAALVGMLLIEALRQQQSPAAALAPGQAGRLAAARQGARALAGELRAVREELARARAQVQRQQQEIDRLASGLPRRREEEGSSGAAERLSRLPIGGPHSVLLLRIAEIDYAECRRHQVFVRAQSGEHLTPYTLAELEARLPAALFCRVHPAYLVNLDRVRDLVFRDGDDGEIRLTDGQRLPVEPGRCPELQRRLGLAETPSR